MKMISFAASPTRTLRFHESIPFHTNDCLSVVGWIIISAKKGRVGIFHSHCGNKFTELDGTGGGTQGEGW